MARDDRPRRPGVASSSDRSGSDGRSGAGRADSRRSGRRVRRATPSSAAPSGPSTRGSTRTPRSSAAASAGAAKARGVFAIRTLTLPGVGSAPIVTARRAIVLALVVCALALTLTVPLRTYFSQKSEQENLTAQRVLLESDIAVLQTKQNQLADPAYIRAQARERLGFVNPGDIPYQVQLPSPPPPTKDQQRAAARAVNPWYTDLWKTISDDPAS